MKTAGSIVVLMPLPRQIEASNRAQLSDKIASLRKTHGDFMATPYYYQHHCIAYLRA